jgi:hypothetical protein
MKKIIKGLDFCIDFIMLLFIIIAISFLLVYLGYGAYSILKFFNAWHLEITDIIHAIECFFIAPLPLIILLAVYNYYRNVASVVLRRFYNPIEDQQQTSKKIQNFRQAFTDLSTAKYFFSSIIISILFVYLLEIFLTIKDAIEKTKQLPILDSTQNKIQPIFNMEYFWNNYFHFIAIAVVLIILLLFYIKIVGNHKDLPNHAEDQKTHTDGKDIRQAAADRKKV